MIRVAVVDDELEVRERIGLMTERVAAEAGEPVEIVSFENGLSFLGRYEKDFDLILMDIEMPGMNGMETAKALRKMDQKVVLIFITNLAQYAVAGYEVEALDYIVKPIVEGSFRLKMKRALSRIEKRMDDYIQIRDDQETRNIRIASIQYVEIFGHYLKWHTTQGVYEEYSTLREAEARIHRSSFIRCNRSCLVNMRFVDSVRRDSILIAGEELSISRPQKKAFLSSYTAFLGGGFL